MRGEDETRGFTCLRCGECCRVRGFVRVNAAEIDRIAAFLEMHPRDLIRGYTRLAHDRRALELLERENGDCVFLRGNECAINSVKPRQCRTFPDGWSYPGVAHICSAYGKRQHA